MRPQQPDLQPETAELDQLWIRDVRRYTWIALAVLAWLTVKYLLKMN